MKHVKPYSRWKLASTSCVIALVAIIAVVPWRVVAQEAPPEPGSTPLADAVKQFNAEAAASKVGKDQPALTEDEVIAAIRWTLKEKLFADVTKSEYAALQKVADTKRLPKDARFEVQTGFRPGDELDYTIWSVRLQMPRGKPHLTYGFPIRDRYVTVERTDPYSTDSPPSRRRFSNSLRPAAEKIDESLPTLAEAIKNFNAEAASYKLGKNQPPLTEGEVTAALYWTEMGRKLKDVTDKEYAALEQVAKTGRLPKNADFEVVTGFIPGDGHTYEKWSVRLRMPRETAGSTYGFIVREQFLNVRPTDPEETDSPRAKVSKAKAPPTAFVAVAEQSGTAKPAKTQSETAHKNPASQPLMGGEPAKDSASPTPVDKPSKEIEKLLVGVWRNASGSLVEFYQDGNYEDFGVQIFGERIRPAQPDSENVRWPKYRYLRTQGAWTVQDGYLYLKKRDSKDRWALKALQTEPSGPTSRLAITKIDQEFLRTRTTWTDRDFGNTFFLRRVDRKPAGEVYADLPAQLRPLAELSNLTTEQGPLWNKWLERQKIDTDLLQTVERVQQVRQRKISLAQLFDMNAEEVAVFQALVAQVGNNHSELDHLAKGGQLTDLEKRSFEKIVRVLTDFDKLIGTRNEVTTNDDREASAILRFYTAVENLRNWLNRLVFEVLEARAVVPGTS